MTARQARVDGGQNESEGRRTALWACRPDENSPVVDGGGAQLLDDVPGRCLLLGLYLQAYRRLQSLVPALPVFRGSQSTGSRRFAGDSSCLTTVRFNGPTGFSTYRLCERASLRLVSTNGPTRPTLSLNTYTTAGPMRSLLLLAPGLNRWSLPSPPQRSFYRRYAAPTRPPLTP